jgi:transposase InsO family protein
MAEAHTVTLRSLRTWKRIDPAVPRARPGRPALGEDVLAEARKLVETQLEEQGWSAGEEPIWRGLSKSIPRARVRLVLRELKADRRRRRAGHVRDARVSVEVLVRDGVWSLDATHLGRDPWGSEVQAEVLREVSSTRTIGLSVGPSATARDITALLDSAVALRRTAPLVLQTDNGGAYRSVVVADWCKAHGVAQLFSLPRTPQHNAAAEHGMRELKEQAALGKGQLVADHAKARARLEQARDVLDGHRLRRTRGWLTAEESDSEHPPWASVASREEVQMRLSCRIDQAVLHSAPGRARRRAEREAILATLQELSVIQRTRGGRPWTAQPAEDDS